MVDVTVTMTHDEYDAMRTLASLASVCGGHLPVTTPVKVRDELRTLKSVALKTGWS